MKRLIAFLALTAFTLHAAPPPPVGKTRAIFDGKTIDGWESPSPELWKIEDGCLTGGDGTTRVPHNDFLCTKASFSNFILRLKIKLTGDPATGLINSGIQIRTARKPSGDPEVSGYQADYGEPGWYGGIYDEGRRDKFIAPADMAVLHPAIKLWDWNEYVIRADGPRIQTWINGVQGVDFTEADPNIAQDGIIGIQVHGGGNTKVQVKDVTIEELPPTPNAPTWDKVGRPGQKKPAKDSDARENAGAGVKPMKEGNAPNANGVKTPEEERAAFKLPPGFEIELVAAESDGIGKFVPLVFDQKGRLWTSTAFEYPVDGNENPAASDALYSGRGRDKVLIFDRDPKSPTGYASTPHVFADGLAITEGLLPYKNGAYVQHGHEIVFLDDTDGDGKADKRTVILSGFGVQDSHLFPHQFTRAPGGWIWMAQGAFNFGKVKIKNGEEIQFDRTRMARFRPDGSQFDITSNGPCNIWGLVITGEGESWIQEANDYGYPVMPFSEYANYPGCSNAVFKSYAPEFPGTAPDFEMGGTGLSGLALSDKTGAWPEPYADVMYLANPITRTIDAIKITTENGRYKYKHLPDFITTSDEMFRPVAITFGPDGCLYIIDWYNKIISHNEVPRNHPDRDKSRGRIWRVKATAQKLFEVPDFTALTGDQLLDKLGGDSLAQHHLAWQTIIDRPATELAPKLRAQILDKTKTPAQRIGAFWALEGLGKVDAALLQPLLADANGNVRREAIHAFADLQIPANEIIPALKPLTADPVPEVRAEIIRTAGSLVSQPYGAGFTNGAHPDASAIALLAQMAREPLAGPLAPSTQNKKPQKVREAYERDFERYLVRLFLEPQPQAVAEFLDSDAAKNLPVEGRLLASLALEPKASATRVAQLLPKLTRAPEQEEVLRLAQFPADPGVGEALGATLKNPATRTATLEALLAVRTRLDAAKLTPFLADAATALLAGSDAASVALGVKLAGGFKLANTEPALLALVKSSTSNDSALAALRALAEIGSGQTELFAKLAESSPDQTIRDVALAALASSKAADAPARVLALYGKLGPTQRRVALDRLTMTKSGAKSVVTAVRAGTIPKTDLDGPNVENLQTVLPGDADLALLSQDLDALFHPVLALDGSTEAWSETGLTLDGPFTVETWVRLNPGIGNHDGILGAPGQLDMNFYDSKFRVWAGGTINDAIIAKKPVVPDVWTHVAVTRDEKGLFKIYQDGELDNDQSKPASHKIENVRVAWTGSGKGTAGALSEFRIWNRVRSADEIRANFERSYEGRSKPDGLVFYATGNGPWGTLHRGAKVAKTSDAPPLLNDEEVKVLDEKFTKYRALANQGGNVEQGKAITVLCRACHLINGDGANIGPNISGAGAMGVEALLRRLITPNAAMESAYHVYRAEMRDGSVREGFFVSDDGEAVVLRMPGAQDQRIPRAEIRETKFLRRGLMPEGLLDGMSPQQVSDLFAYLKTLK